MRHDVIRNCTDVTVFCFIKRFNTSKVQSGLLEGAVVSVAGFASGEAQILVIKVETAPDEQEGCIQGNLTTCTLLIRVYQQRWKFLKVLSVVAFLASFCDALYYRTDTPCDFTGVSIDDEVLSRLITRLPEGLESGPEGLYMLFPGFEVGRQTFDGLRQAAEVRTHDSLLRQRNPHGASRLLQRMTTRTSGRHGRPARGDEGRVVVRARIHSGVRLEVDGAGRVVRGVFEVLSMLLPSFVEELWMGQFFQNLHEGFRSMNEENAFM
ncbi:hypothetical protein MRX96_043273 [Rhipicephalus microplus]